jgi:hypothetical protein
MNKLLLCSLLSVLSLVATAQNTPAPVTAVRVPAYERIELPRQIHHLFPDEVNEYKGSYGLSNGDTLTLRAFGSRLYAQLGNGPRKELVAAARGVFVSVDEKMKITFKEDRFGELKGDVLMLVPRSAPLS